MSSDEIKLRERAREITSLRLASQQRILAERTTQLKVAVARQTAASKTFRTAWNELRLGKVNSALVPLLSKDILRCEKLVKETDLKVTEHKALIQKDSARYAQLDAIYSRLTSEITRDEQIEIERALEEFVEERTAVAASSSTEAQNFDSTIGDIQAQTDLSPNLSFRRVVGESSSSNRQITGDHSGSNSKQGESRNSSEGGHSYKATAARSAAKVGDVKQLCDASQMQLSDLKTWSRLEAQGLQLDIKLPSGVPVSVSISKNGGDQALTVRISRSCDHAHQLSRIRSEIAQALKSKGLKVREVIICEEVK